MDLMLLTHNSSASFSNPIHFISTPTKKIRVHFNASATPFILISTVLKFLPWCMSKVMFLVLFGILTRTTIIFFLLVFLMPQ